MPNKLAHFAIEADDVERALGFFQAVFGWRFSPWGPPGFYLVEGAGVHAALQQRREPLPSGRKGYECSFAVSDIDATSALIEASGGRLLSQKHTIPTVCELRQFADTEGNEAIICQYAPDRLREMGLSD